MKYFLYCRKSSDREDKQLLSLASQQREMEQYAIDKGLEIIHIHPEEQSAYKTGREYFNDMLERIKKGEAQGIITWHLSRLARNSHDGGALVYMVDEGLIQEIHTKERVYRNTTTDKFFLQLEFAVAKKSSDDTGDYVRRDLKAKLEKGEWIAVAPLGYLNMDRNGRIAGNMYDQEKQRKLIDLARPLKRVEVDPTEGLFIKELFLRAAQPDMSLKKLEDYAWELGLRTRKKKLRVKLSTISWILNNPFYYGMMRYDEDKLFPGNYEPLVTKDLFEKVQLGLKNTGKSRMQKHEFEYTGIIRCGTCGAMITAEKHGKYTYYRCTKKKGVCDAPYVTEENLEKMLVKKLRKVQLPQEFVVFAHAILKSWHGDSTKNKLEDQKKLHAEEDDLRKHLDNLLLLKISPANKDGQMLSDEEFLRQKRFIDSKLKDVEEKVRDNKGDHESWYERCERLFTFASQILAQFNGGGLEKKHLVLRTVGTSYILKDGEIEFEYKDLFQIFARLEKRQTILQKRLSSDDEGLFTNWRDWRDSNS